MVNSSRVSILGRSAISLLVALTLFSFAGIRADAAPGKSAKKSDAVLSESEVAKAQDSGKYGDYLKQRAGDESYSAQIREQLIQELEAIRKLPNAEREKAFNNILYYYSESNDAHKKTPLRLDLEVGISETELKAGNYEATHVADRLLQAVDGYQQNTLVPIMKSIESELGKDFKKENFVFLGRDFAPVYLWMSQTGAVDANRMTLVNASRAVRDEVLEGKTAELRTLLDQVGLDRKAVLENGVVFLDSSMSGKIPAAILKALVQDMSDSDRYTLLRNTEVRYVKSSREAGTPLSKKAKELGGKDKKLTLEQANSLLERLDGIQEFKFKTPGGFEALEIANHRHHFFEHRPKSVNTAQGIVGSNKKGGVRLDYAEAKTPGDRVKTLLGLQSDLDLVRMARGLTIAKPAPVKEVAKSTSLLPADTQKEIDGVAKSGRSELKNWVKQADPKTTSLAATMSVAKTSDKEFPLELKLGGKTVYRIRKKLGEGNNVEVYLTEEGTALKVIKEADNARKQLLQAWAEPIVNSYGIPTAKTLNVGAGGLYLEQELIPGESLEYTYGFGHATPPKSIEDQVQDHWEKARRLGEEKGIWLDLKAANYHVRDGKIINVDYGPRLNSTYYRYFNDDNGKALSTAEFKDLFYFNDVKKGSAYKTPTEASSEPPAAKSNSAKSGVAKVETFTGSHFKKGETIQTPAGVSYEILKEIAGSGEDRRVYQAKNTATGQVVALKAPRTDKPEFVEGIAKEIQRAAQTAKLELNMAQVIESGNDFIIREWVEGQRGDDWIKNWEANGMKPNDPGVKDLAKLIKKSSANGGYVGKLDPEDMVWDGKRWMIVDSGGVKSMSTKDALERYQDKLVGRWDAFLSESNRSCLFDLMKAKLKP